MAIGPRLGTRRSMDRCLESFFLQIGLNKKRTLAYRFLTSLESRNKKVGNEKRHSYCKERAIEATCVANGYTKFLNQNLEKHVFFLFQDSLQPELMEALQRRTLPVFVSMLHNCQIEKPKWQIDLKAELDKAIGKITKPATLTLISVSLVITFKLFL